ncbi:MAG: DNA-directed RNA polymerase subunit omega [Deltaproteobacteria bacterium]|nr:DNA-directed RNA polymerase subunit omega [Deltaproteobacteria bacterium]
MARITVEDCLQKVDNRFTIIHMAAKRVRQLRKGAEPTIVSKNKDIVVSLREIAAGNVKKVEPDEQAALLEEGEPQPPEEGEGDTQEDSSQPDGVTEEPESS